MEFGVRTECENISEQIYVYVFQMTCDQTVYTSARRTSGKHPTRGKIDSGKLYRWKHYVRKGSLKTRQRPILLGATRASAAPPMGRRVFGPSAVDGEPISDASRDVFENI